MARKLLRFEEVPHLQDGRVAAHMNELQAAAIADCINRPGEKKERTVSLTLHFKPIPDGREVGDIDVSFSFKSTAPKRQCPGILMAPAGAESLMYSEHSPEDPRQDTFEFKREEEER